jgi:hypothetical protein
MSSVTRDRKKYGAPTIYSEAQRQKEAKSLREAEQGYYRACDHRRESLNEGSDVGRVYPLIEDDQ